MPEYETKYDTKKYNFKCVFFETQNRVKIGQLERFTNNGLAKQLFLHNDWIFLFCTFYVNCTSAALKFKQDGHRKLASNVKGSHNGRKFIPYLNFHFPFALQAIKTLKKLYRNTANSVTIILA